MCGRCCSTSTLRKVFGRCSWVELMLSYSWWWFRHWFADHQAEKRGLLTHGAVWAMYGVILKLQNLSEAVKFSALMELSFIQRPNMVFAISRLQFYSLTTPVCTSRCTTISTTERVHRRIIQYMMHEVTECWSFKLDIAWESIPKIKRQTRKWRNVSCFVQSGTTRDFFAFEIWM